MHKVPKTEEETGNMPIPLLGLVHGHLHIGSWVLSINQFVSSQSNSFLFVTNV